MHHGCDWYLHPLGLFHQVYYIYIDELTVTSNLVPKASCKMYHMHTFVCRDCYAESQKSQYLSLLVVSHFGLGNRCVVALVCPPSRALFGGVHNLIRRLCQIYYKFGCEHNSEQKIPNCAPHFARCAVCSPWRINKALHGQFLFRITAAATASLLSILVRFLKFVPVMLT